MLKNSYIGFNICQRLRGKIIKTIRQETSDFDKASLFFKNILAQLKTCSHKNTELDTLYKNAMTLGDFWTLGSSDFKERINESFLLKDSKNDLFLAFAEGAKISGISGKNKEKKKNELSALEEMALIEPTSCDILNSYFLGIKKLPPQTTKPFYFRQHYTESKLDEILVSVKKAFYEYQLRLRGYECFPKEVRSPFFYGENSSRFDLVCSLRTDVWADVLENPLRGSIADITKITSKKYTALVIRKDETEKYLILKIYDESNFNEPNFICLPTHTYSEEAENIDVGQEVSIVPIPYGEICKKDSTN